ncbi:MAG: glycosyltransferase family 4 protein [Ginsengibacter sp.]
MKILIPVLGFGHFGGYRVLSKLADELIKLGNCVEFLSPDTSESPYFPTSARILWADKNGNLKPNNNEKGMGKKGSALSNQKQLTKAFLKLDSELYDIIIANHSLTTIPIKIAGLSHKTLYYVQAYEPDYYRFMPGIKNKILKILSASSYKMNLFTVVNAEVYLKYKNLKASRVLYPGVDFNNFYPSKATSKNDNEIIIGTIGRLEPQKGTHYVLKAFIKLKKKYPRIKLHIAFGNARDFSDFEDVYCFQPHGDRALGEYYRSLDFYLCAGFTQLGAFHYPVVEAMSCGISVITTQYYPANNNNAWLVQPENVEDLIRSFEMAYNSTELREQKIQQALTDVQQFEWGAVGEKLNEYINELKEKAAIQ